MFPDLERKLLRIIHNYWSQRHRMPTMTELERTTGRYEPDIVAGLQQLEIEEYLHWPDKSTLFSLKLLHAPQFEERAVSKARRGMRSDIEYWTNY
ncbi:hypothetical protein [Paenibacillus lentus]|uniref:Uncharacterized protein n=1 Tax=Paenibacillus lentus TaxID=1338368 RepID=A0A3Q8SBB7_9BACL|nr:hypothetical protein [Paenibacillus lentus]AZK46709.1 hypothetical protein EIM92_11555 [Paenibacillus lentus]